MMKRTFNSESQYSSRDRKKSARRFLFDVKRSNFMSDESGTINGQEKDLCDCLIEDCPGCHFPCRKCRSLKCGQDCRISRKWLYEAIENEGDDNK